MCVAKCVCSHDVAQRGLKRGVMVFTVLGQCAAIQGGIPGSGFSENSELFNPEKRQTQKFPFQKER